MSDFTLGIVVGVTATCFGMFLRGLLGAMWRDLGPKRKEIPE